MQCFALAFGARLVSILMYPSYLPFDRSGDWVYRGCEVLSFVLALLIVAALVIPSKAARQSSMDIFGNELLPPKLGALLAIVPSLVLAVPFHANLNGNWVTDTLWAFALYLEAAAPLPQRQLVWHRGGQVDEFNAAAIFSLFVARLFSLWFWAFSYKELNDKYKNAYPGHVVLLSQLASLATLGAFAYEYIKAARSRKALIVLPM
jgi:ER lumen protein retaining receptor